MTFKRAHVTVEDRSSRLRKAFHRAAPAIGGDNLFTGEYSGRFSHLSITSSSQYDWQTFWSHVGDKPPGPLPRGATAIMIAENSSGDPVKLEPSSVVRRGGNITVTRPNTTASRWHLFC